MPRPRTARIEFKGQPGWLVVFPNGVAFAVQDNPRQHVQGLPQVWHFELDLDELCRYFDTDKFTGTVVEWLDAPPPPFHSDDPFG